VAISLAEIIRMNYALLMATPRQSAQAVVAPLSAADVISSDYSPALRGGELALVLAAERLFAEHGISGVSLRQVVHGAGHKNMSAAHYHFGSRDGLLRAVMELRMSRINSCRSELFARASSSPAGHDLRFYVEAFVLPLADQLTPRPEGNYCLRFLEQYRHFPTDYELLLRLEPTAFQMAEQIKRLLSYLPKPIVDARLNNAWSMIVAALAAIEEHISDGRQSVRDLPLLTADLVDTMTAALSAPLSSETLSHLPS
jgi:AcrR family transcriptional regulator